MSRLLAAVVAGSVADLICGRGGVGLVSGGWVRRVGRDQNEGKGQGEG